MSKKYIKGKDGKMQGSLPTAPQIPSSVEIPSLPTLPVQEPTSDSNYTKAGKTLDEMNRLEAESNKTLSEGFSEISKAFENIEAIIREGQERSKLRLEEAKTRSAVAALKAATAKANYEALLLKEAQAKEARKPINVIKRFFKIN